MAYDAYATSLKTMSDSPNAVDISWEVENNDSSALEIISDIQIGGKYIESFSVTLEPGEAFDYQHSYENVPSGEIECCVEATGRESDTSGEDILALGGGKGYDEAVEESDGDYVVGEGYSFTGALRAASEGDIVFVPGDMTIDTGPADVDISNGVTLASDRGADGSEGALLHTDETPQVMLRPQSNVRVTGLRIRGPTPGETVTYQDRLNFSTPTYAMKVEGKGVEVDNCEIWGWPDRAVYAYGENAHVHHNYIYDNNGQGLGYGVSARGDCLIEYNYFHNNRHSVTASEDSAGYTAKHNHFSSKSVMWPIDIHGPFEGNTTIKENIVENGESRTWDNPAVEGIAGYDEGFDGGSLSIINNWFFDEGTAFDGGFPEVTSSGNIYGGESSHDPGEIIPNHPGMEDRPWT